MLICIITSMMSVFRIIDVEEDIVRVNFFVKKIVLLK